MRLPHLIWKNFKLLVRSKTSALIIFVGPLLLVSLLGLAFSHSSNFQLTASIYSPSYSDLSESLVKKMMNQNLRVERQDTEENCINAVKRSEAQACIMFPPQMKVQEGQQNNVTFYVDYNQLNVVWMMLDVMEARVSERSSEISADLTRDLLDRLWFVQDKVRTGQERLDALKQDAVNIQALSSGGRGDVKSMNINVTFESDIETSKDDTDKMLLLVSDWKTDISEAVTLIDTSADNIETSAQYIKDEVNDSGVWDDIITIQDKVIVIRDEASELNAATTLNNQDLTEKITRIKNSLHDLGSSVALAQTQVTSVKQQKEDIVPVFDNINTELDRLTQSINTLKGIMDQAVAEVDSLKVKSPQSIVSPINTEIKPISVQNTHFNSLFPVLLVLIVMITGILLGSTLVLGEKKSKAFFRNNLVPTSYFTFSLATYFTGLAVLMLQLLLFVSVSAFFFETPILASLWLIVLLVFLIATVFIILGMFIGFLFATEATATLASITLSSILLLFSSTVIPMQGMGELTRMIIRYNPFVISENALRQTILFNFRIDTLGMSLGLLAGYAVGVFVLLIVLQDVLRRLSFLQVKKAEKPAIVKEKKAEKKLTSEMPKVENAANELLVNPTKEEKK
ncbi:ABC transporter permease [Nanoarchaeota archaeon]